MVQGSYYLEVRFCVDPGLPSRCSPQSPIGLGTDFGFYQNLGSIFYADFKISG